MTIEHLIPTTANTHAPLLTYGATGSTVLLWGLHLSDIAVILSAMASVCGVVLQFYIAIHRIRRLERQQDAGKKVASALAEGIRVLDKTKEPKSGDN